MVTLVPTWFCRTRKLWRSADKDTSAQLGRVSIRDDVRVVANNSMIPLPRVSDELWRVTMPMLSSRPSRRVGGQRASILDGSFKHAGLAAHRNRCTEQWRNCQIG